MRKRLKKLTGTTAVPMVFAGGKFFGDEDAVEAAIIDETF